MNDWIGERTMTSEVALVNETSGFVDHLHGLLGSGGERAGREYCTQRSKIAMTVIGKDGGSPDTIAECSWPGDQIFSFLHHHHRRLSGRVAVVVVLCLPFTCNVRGVGAPAVKRPDMFLIQCLLPSQRTRN